MASGRHVHEESYQRGRPMMGVSSVFTILLVLSSVILLGRADIISDIVSALENAVDCASCQAVLLPPVQLLADLGDDAFVATFTEICETLQVTFLPCPHSFSAAEEIYDELFSWQTMQYVRAPSTRLV